MGPGDGRQSERRAALYSGGGARHGGAWSWQDHQCQFHRGPLRQLWPIQLCRRQSRRDRDDQSLGTRAGPQGHQRKCRRAWIHQDRNGNGGAARGASSPAVANPHGKNGPAARCRAGISISRLRRLRLCARRGAVRGWRAVAMRFRVIRVACNARGILKTMNARIAFAVIPCLALLLACSESKPASAAASPVAAPAAGSTATQQPAAAPPAQPQTPAGSARPATHFNAERTMQYTREIVAFGPRYNGTAALEKVRQYLRTHLKGDQVEQDSFTADTPAGKQHMVNIIAKFPGSKDGIIVVASHYETNYWLRNIHFVGANDGACTSAMLLELA